MGPITIVTGCPGAGKTTFARQAARTHPRGLHLVADTFYTFPAHVIDPTKPESADQNTAIITALGRAAGSFAESDYAVFLDGIFGPWFLSTLAAAIWPLRPATDYLVLRCEIDEALARVAGRPEGGDPANVRHMNKAFCDLGDYEASAIDTTHLSEAEVHERVAELRATGAAALDLARLAHRTGSTI